MSELKGIRPMLRVKIAAAIIVAIPVVISGCASSGGNRVASSGSGTDQAMKTSAAIYQDPTATVDLAAVSINNLVNTSDAALIGSVANVSAPQWNSADGQVWEQDLSNPDPNQAQPFQFRTVTISVRSVLFQNEKVAASPGSSLSIRVYGSGSNEGPMLNGNPNDRWNQIAGPFSAGSSELIFVRLVDFPMRNGAQKALVLNDNRDGHWSISGDMAESSVAGRSVPVGALQTRIMSERSRGLVQESSDEQAATAVNPLGESPAGGAGTSG